MNYQYLHMKMDQFITYVNDNKINLIPPFQRGHVWTLSTRKRLIQNIIKRRPIPAIFLYRDVADDGEKFSYNILDGKQRLESLILYVGNERPTLHVKDLSKYFFSSKLAKKANFMVEIGEKKVGLKDLETSLFRDFQEYVIPTIEITLDESTGLDEIISLFVDINQQGVPVQRFSIVKAMCGNDNLLKGSFGLIALHQNRGKDVFYKAKNNDFTKVLKSLQIVDNLEDLNARVDRMWELLVEIVLFQRSMKHRAPVEILKSFIKSASEPKSRQPKISVREIVQLREVFAFLVHAYKNIRLKDSRLVKNQIHFYTMITSIISQGLLRKYAKDVLVKKLDAFGQIIDDKLAPPKGLTKIIEEYRNASAKHTTHPGRRDDRQKAFLQAIDSL